MGEVKKLKLMSPMSAEATVVRNYVDSLIALPWKRKSKVSKDLKNAQKILDEDHHGLEKVKERILEYLAVQQRVKKVKARDGRSINFGDVAVVRRTFRQAEGWSRVN